MQATLNQRKEQPSLGAPSWDSESWNWNLHQRKRWTFTSYKNQYFQICLQAYKVELEDGQVLELDGIFEGRNRSNSFKIPLEDGQTIEIVSEYEEHNNEEGAETFKVMLEDGEEFEIPAEFDTSVETNERVPSAPR